MTTTLYSPEPWHLQPECRVLREGEALLGSKPQTTNQGEVGCKITILRQSQLTLDRPTITLRPSKGPRGPQKGKMKVGRIQDRLHYAYLYIYTHIHILIYTCYIYICIHIYIYIEIHMRPGLAASGALGLSDHLTHPPTASQSCGWGLPIYLSVCPSV